MNKYYHEDSDYKKKKNMRSNLQELKLKFCQRKQHWSNIFFLKTNDRRQTLYTFSNQTIRRWIPFSLQSSD